MRILTCSQENCANPCLFAAHVHQLCVTSAFCKLCFTTAMSDSAAHVRMLSDCMHGCLERLLSQAMDESSMYRVVKLSDAHHLASHRLDAELSLLYGSV